MSMLAVCRGGNARFFMASTNGNLRISVTPLSAVMRPPLAAPRGMTGTMRSHVHHHQHRWRSSTGEVTTSSALPAPTTAATNGGTAAASTTKSSRAVARRGRLLGLLALGRAKIAKCALKPGTKQKRKEPSTSTSNAELKKAQEAAAAASERTHAATSRLNLSRNSLMLRFSNENSYLNWARNGVLSSGVGVAMYAQEHHRGAQLSGAGLMLLGFGYIGAGTLKYIYYILRFRQAMELSWMTVFTSISHASIALMIWLTATASFLESVPLELDAVLLTEPLVSYLPFRIRQGLIETYSLYLDDLEHHNDEQERVLRAIRGGKEVGLLDDDEVELPVDSPLPPTKRE